MRRLFGTDGIRGIANETLCCETAMKIGRAMASILASDEKRRLVILGMDTRISSEMLANSITAGLSSVGIDSVNVGVIPTPAVAYLVTKYGADAGIMISASHNSYEYNGIKIFNSDGFKLPDELEERIESVVFEEPGNVINASSNRIGRMYSENSAVTDYTQHLLSAVDSDLTGLKIAVDCANGASYATAKDLFRKLGAECIMLSYSPNGTNINKKCGSTDMRLLREYVIREKLDAGIAFDGDADRCLCIDEKGETVDGDSIMASISLDMKKRGMLRKNTVVGTVMTNYGFEVFCNKNSINFIPANVGDRYVLEEMVNGDYNFGGEQSGHIIFRDFATTGDGQLTAVKFLSMVKREGKKVSEITSVMKKYPQHMINLKVTQESKVAFFTDSEIKEIIAESKRKLRNRGRILVRPSGTEELLRIMVEGEDDIQTVKAAKETAEKISEVLKKY